jgi:hypothetical protein
MYMWFANRDGGDSENLSDADSTMSEGRSHDGKWQLPFARDDGEDSGRCRARLKSESIWEERSGGLQIGRRGS